MRRRFLQILLGLCATVLALEVTLQAASFLARRDLENRRPGERAEAVAGSDSIQVLCVGDSHTWGAGVNPDDNYPSQLAGLLHERYPRRNITVINLGLPGVNSAHVAKRLESQIIEYRPQLAIVWVGTNNMWNSLETDDGGGLAATLHAAFLRSKVYRLGTVLWHTSVAAGRGDDPVGGDVQRADRTLEYQRWRAAGSPRSAESVERGLRRDMERMVETASALDTKLLFVTYPQPDQKLPVSEVIERGASDLGVPVVVTRDDLARAQSDGLREGQLFVFAAGPHPTARLYGYIVESIFPHVNAAIRGGPDRAP